MSDLSYMLSNGKRQDNAKSEGKSLDARRVRAGLIMIDQTLRGIARKHGVSHTLVKLILKGAHPSRSGKSQAIRRELEDIAA